MSQKAHRVLITDAAIQPEGVAMLEAVAEVTILPSYQSEADLVKAAESVDAILARTAVISEAVIRASSKLKIVSRHGVGVDNVDLAACTACGVMVTITGDANSQAVSEYAFGSILAAARKIPLANAHVKGGNWDRTLFVGTEMQGKTLGIVGLGRIGTRLVRQATGFDMDVLAYDPYVTADSLQAENVTLVDLETLIRQADFVSLHMPLTPETRHIIGPAELALMKPSAILVNSARGGLIDEEALYQTLKAKRIAGAVLDVFEDEPLPANHPLTKLDNLICSPHIAGQTAESLVRMSIGAAENILQVFRGEIPAFVVNREVVKSKG